MIIEKPAHKMKVIVKLMEKCVNPEEVCNGCPYINDVNCLSNLMKDGAYYLKQTLEKSEGAKNGRL